jgi:hypothetical protein
MNIVDLSLGPHTLGSLHCIDILVSEQNRQTRHFTKHERVACGVARFKVQQLVHSQLFHLYIHGYLKHMQTTQHSGS